MGNNTANDSILPDFLIIPSQIIMDKDLQPLDGQVYGIIYWYSKMKLEICFASSKNVADLLNSTEGGVQNAINRLVAKNHIKSTYSRTTHQRELTPLINFGSTTSNDVVAPHQMNDSTTSNDVFDMNKNIKQEDINNNKKKVLTKVNTKEKENRSVTSVTSPPLKRYSLLEDLKKQDLEDIAQKYHVPLSFVLSKHDDMVIWAGSRPGNGKLKGRNWKLTLMQFVKQDAIKIREKNKGGSRAVDVEAGIEFIERGKTSVTVS